MSKILFFLSILSSITLTCNASSSEVVSVVDFSGATVSLKQRAQRIIALSPHAVENTFSAGAGEYLVGVVAYSDFPEQAKSITQVGSNNLLNYESIVALEPDLIIAWQSGNTGSSLKRLRDLGFTIYLDEPKSLEDVAKSIRDIAKLAGTSEIAKLTTDSYLSELKHLRINNINKEKVSVFYQVWNQPLQTLNGKHLVSTAIELCGGNNIYADLPNIAPIINIESIINRDPNVIIASGASNNERPHWLDDWQQWPQLTAVKNRNLFHVPADHLLRHTIRILKGISTVCNQLNQVRAKANL